MTSLFASPDIAALVAAFPPPLPTRNQPSLVRSNSGNGLLNSSTVLDRFRTLLETEPNRLRKADLPHRFGIERIDWLLECYDSLPRIRWSRDGGSLIPEPVWKRLINDLTIRCSKNFIGIKSYAKAENIEDLSAEDQARLIEGYSLEAISPQLGRHDETQDFDAYLASKKLVEKTRAEIQSSMAGPSDENVNISRIYSTIPTTVLKQLVKEIIPIDQLEFEGEDFIFVPASYYSTQEERLRADREARIQSLLEKFENDDFVRVDISTQTLDDNDAEEIRKRYTDLHADVEVPTILDVDAANQVVVLPVLLDRTNRELREEAASLASISADDSIDSLDDSKSKLCSACSEPVFASILLKLPPYSDQITSAMRDVQLEKEQKRLEEFSVSFRREVISSIQLYASGVAYITDAKLKSNLNEYVCTHFRNDVIPSLFRAARADGLLGNGKSKFREGDKLLERSTQSKTVEELVTAATKYAKKVKVHVPNDADIGSVQKEVLERKAFSEMPKMQRGSDLLQNLVWILLSAATSNNLQPATTNGASTIASPHVHPTNFLGDRPALFMSPGKDTGRMIKQYFAIAPADIETAKMLGIWREKLKSASESDDDLEEMRTLAKKVVGELFAERDRNVDVATNETIT